MAKLSLKHIYKIYDNGTKAVNDFNLDIGDDEFIVFVGPSGCGKSTTLRMIAGLEDITAGDFFIDGELANQLEPKDRDMAMVFQNYALYPHMSVYENMAFGLRIRHVPKTEIDQRVQEAARILDISDQLNKKPKEMSGGQRQRVALGRAIVRKPKVFLLDEPLSNLDAKLRSSMRSEITRLHNVLKTTFIYVTHDQVEAMTMGTKIVVMNKGYIQQVDTPMNLYDYPGNIFVAGFIGTPQMNFIDGKLSIIDEENLKITIGETDIICPREKLAKIDMINAYLEKEVKVGIRPEHLYLSDSDSNSLKMNISIVEALGNDSNLILDDNSGNLHLVARILRQDSLQVGQEIHVGLDLNKIHLFDKETELSLLPRIPPQITVKADYHDGELKIFNTKIKISDNLSTKLEGHEHLFISIPTSAVSEKGNINLPIVNKENINGQWLNTIKEGNDFLYLLSDEYIYGDSTDISLDLAKITFFDEQLNILIEPLNENNIISGYLVPSQKKMRVYKKTMITEEDEQKLLEKTQEENQKAPKIKLMNKKLFNYALLGKEMEPSDNSLIKVYSLLGKKFEMHDINFEISAKAILISDDENDYTAHIEEILDYGNDTYYRVSVLDNVNNEEHHLLVLSDKNIRNIGDAIHLHIEEKDVGVVDVNFGVKLI